MGGGGAITIKNYHNGGGDLTLKIKGAQYSESASNGGRNRLIIYRDPDQYSSRLGMFAYLWHNQPGYETLGFPELSLQFTQCNDSGVVISIATNVYFSVYVDSIKPDGTEEV